jgi:capsular exopolysaccharide synthesis family protein
MKAEHPSQPLPIAQPLQFQDEEGGLELGQVLEAIRRRLLLIAGVTTVITSLAVLKAFNSTPIYSAGFEILTKSVTVETEVISSVPQTLTSKQDAKAADAPPTIDDTKIRVLRSSSLLTPIVDELKKKYPDFSYDVLNQNLAIQAGQDGILTVSYQNPNPDIVRAIVIPLSKTYLNYSLEDRQKDIRQGIAFVEDQLPKLEKRVSDEQQQLQQFRQQYNLIDPEVQARQLSEQVGAFSQQQLTTQAQLSEMQLLYRELQNELAQQPAELAAASPLNQSPRYQQLLNQLLAIDAQMAQSSSLYLQTSPEMQVLQEQRQSLVPLLQREGQRVERQVRSQIEELENRNQALQQSVDQLNQQIKRLSSVTRTYTDIQRELDIATNNLNQFQQKREALRIDAAQRQIPWQLLTPPAEPIASNAASVKRNLILGAILGMLLGSGVALAVDKFSNVIHTSKEVKNLTKLPLLGVIPINPSLQDGGTSRLISWLEQENYAYELSGDRQALQQTSIPFLEAFRSLYANLRSISPTRPVHSVVISSPNPASGKTMMAFHLAQAAASMGRRVLLIDADLRRPSLHRQLGIDNLQGLTEVASASLDFENAIQRVPWEGNLFVMTAGNILPDPVRVLSSQAMQHFMARSRELFDFIIYDAPPLLGLADAHLLASNTDGLLLVVRLGHVKRPLLQQTMEELRVSAVPVLGAIANCSKDQVVRTHNFYHYHTQAPGFETLDAITQNNSLKKPAAALNFLKKLKQR